jgi:hypothetical protein
MDIQSQKSYLFLHDRFLSACGSELCFFLNHSLTHGQRSRTGHSMMTSVAPRRVAVTGKLVVLRRPFSPKSS